MNISLRFFRSIVSKFHRSIQKMADRLPSERERYIATMVLGGVGDALGYNNDTWELIEDGRVIHNQVEALGGLSKLDISNFRVSDDTVMHLATARALVDDSSAQKPGLFNNLAREYIECMNDMTGRAAGKNTIASCAKLKEMRVAKPQANIFRVPFNPRAGGCGAAMRSMCIGLRYSVESELDDLIAVSIESGRVTHHNPVGYLGSLVSALFTSYALQGRPQRCWGAKLVNSVLPIAKYYVEESGVEVEANLKDWSNFEEKWRDYLRMRQLLDGTLDPVFPEKYGVEERDEFYKKISHSGWGGSSGHDSTIIAYDALLGCCGSWIELCNRCSMRKQLNTYPRLVCMIRNTGVGMWVRDLNRVVFHGGDNDSTGGIAASWFGALYGLNGVYGLNYESLEYRNELERLGDQLFNISHQSPGR